MPFITRRRPCLRLAQAVLQSAFGANVGMDACCALYDENYPLYMEPGYVE